MQIMMRNVHSPRSVQKFVSLNSHSSRFQSDTVYGCLSMIPAVNGLNGILPLPDVPTL